MSAATKTCLNCDHRKFGRCVRTGFHCDIEMRCGGRCAGPETGVPKMNLWEPRRTIWMRIRQYFNEGAP